MITKRELQIYLDIFADRVEIDTKRPCKAYLYSGLKPVGYAVPMVLDYLNHPPYREESVHLADSLAWHVEIWINDLCVFRRFGESPDGDHSKAEPRLLQEVFDEIIVSGLLNSWKLVEKHESEKYKRGE